MNKLQKITLISLLVLFAPVFAQAADLVVQFEQGPPLFDEVNFFPGQSVTRWVDVANNSSESKVVVVKATNYSSCSGVCLSDQLELEISDGTSVLYGPVSLTEFFTADEKKIDDLANGNTQRYYFKITFLSGAGNEYQGKAISFDFEIGFFGQETIGGGGGSFGGDSGLIIFHENALLADSNQADIIWETNRQATSRVIYSSQYEPHTLNLNNPPNYGYSRSTVEDPAPVFSHFVNIAGLDAGVTYYYRVVSRGSFAVSVEHSFTVPGIKAAETGPKEEGVAQVAEGEISEISEEESVGAESADEEIIAEEPQDKENLAELFLASLGDLLKLDFCSIFFLLIIIVTVLLLMSLENSKKEENKTKKWTLTLAGIVALIIIYSLFCPYYKALLIVVGILFILFLLWYYFRKGKKAE